MRTPNPAIIPPKVVTGNPVAFEAMERNGTFTVVVGDSVGIFKTEDVVDFL